MKVFNIMLSRELGGIQQAFLDYTEAMRINGYEVFEITSIYSKINSYVQDKDYHIQLLNLGAWDPFSVYQLRAAIKKHKPDLIIAHGRAMRFSLKARIIPDLDLPIIGVSHNYNVKWLKKCDYVFTITEHLRDYVTAHGVKKDTVFLLPNMIDTGSAVEQIKAPSEPIVIGALARFVKNKGIDIMLQALARLKRNGVPFRAIIGGEGPEEKHLRAHALQLGLQDEIEFIGWVYDKHTFFDQIDILCVPSIHEPFGIIILEGMLNRKPIVTTRSEGPSEIIVDGVDGLLCHVGSNIQLSDKLAELIKDPTLREDLGRNAFLSVQEKYDITVGARSLKAILPKILKDYKK